MRYKVTALEKFLVKTVYAVEAPSARVAEKRCKDGLEAYDSHEVQEGDEEWIETLDIQPEG